MLQFISINLVKNGFDPIYILSKNVIVRMKSEKAFHIESNTILSSTINILYSILAILVILAILAVYVILVQS